MIFTHVIEEELMVKTLAVMTSGGDSPGMNAAVRAVVRRAIDCGLNVIGVHGGYEGLVAGGKSLRALKWDDVGGILAKGGTFLGTARSDRFRTAEGRRIAVKNMLELGIQAVVVIGGDGSLMGAHVLSTEWSEHVRALMEDQPDSAPGTVVPALQVVGLPGSIDNDLFGTDMSIGADTSLNHITRAIDDLTATAASHQRTFVVETMGRHCGYLALAAGLAGGVTWVLIPEQELELRWHQKMVSAIESARELGRPHQMVVVAEGARHPDGLHISSADIKKILSERLKIDVRVTVLGHVQRGGISTRSRKKREVAMWHEIKVYMVTVIVFLVLDLTYLGIIMAGFYKSELGALARRSGEALTPVWWAAMVVYVLIPLGIVLFALPRVDAQRWLPSALTWGFLYGVVLYGVYDFTNYATLDRWPLKLTFADIAWGGVLCSVMTAFAAFADRWLRS